MSEHRHLSGMILFRLDLTVMLLMMRVALVGVSCKGVGDGCRCDGVIKGKDVTSASAYTFSCASMDSSDVVFDVRGMGALARDNAAAVSQ
eukprot:7247942-Ditylum_brightwellii.AAC.1